MAGIYISENDLGPVLRLKDFLGADRTRHLRPGQHPLGLGFSALRRYLAGRELVHEERQGLGQLQMIADVIDEHEQTWRPNANKFRADLLSASKCKAMLFEIQVILVAIQGRVGEVQWPIYLEGERDIRTKSPEMLVECKLIQTRTSGGLGYVFKKLQKANKQARPYNVPFVVAVGFEDEFERGAAFEVKNFLQENERWLRTHRLVSGILVLTSVQPRGDIVTSPLKIAGFEVSRGVVTQALKRSGENPMPSGFTFKPV
ncbi:MAG TPA: hypothetical protein VNL15_06535 [Dehalococcoidia bacterium]|nr:hypothetical protein [Dehalococcoidia bacterium]